MTGIDKLYPTMQPTAPAPTSDTDLAARFFDHPTSPKPAPAPGASDMLTGAQANDKAPPADPNAAAAEKLFGDKDAKPFESNAPAEVKELRNTPERRMYPADKAYASDLPEALFETAIGQAGPNGQPITAEQVVQATREYQEMAADLELPPVEVRELVTIFKAERPTPEQQAANRAASFKWLRENHGDRANFALKAAQALVARDPRVARLLDHNGAGDDVRVVQKLVGAALRQVASGKLKVAKA